MNKQIFYIIIAFIIGIIVGWLNPIEGPLDWTYDDYASQKAHKSPFKVAPPIEEKKPTLEIDPWDIEDAINEYENDLLNGRGSNKE